jgi:co-chaperonin GroES (HSP10)
MEDFDFALEDGQTVRPLPNAVLVTNMEHGERVTAAGIIIPDDNGKSSGIKPRWGTVWAVGSNITDVAAGHRVLIAHGRWTRGVKVREPDGSTAVIRMVDPKDILVVMESDH